MPARAEVWWCEPPDISRRPVVVLSRDAGIVRRRRALIAPCTTMSRGLPSEVELSPGINPVPRGCVASLNSVEGVSTALLVERLGRLSDIRTREICSALSIAVDCT